MENVERPNTDIGDFSVKTDVFTGPLELLISLIEKRKLLINDISLASVTDEYLKYVAEMEQLQLKETAQFVVLASTLLLIKSKSLLPVLSLTEEEEENIEDLQNRLKQYQVYKQAAKDLEQLFGTHISYERRFIPSDTPLFLPDRYTEKDALADTLNELISRLPKKTKRPNVQVAKTVSLEHTIVELKQRIEREFRFGFTDFTGNSKERATIIVGFLAVLEMVKQGTVVVRQASTLSEIEIERDSNSVPRYS